MARTRDATQKNTRHAAPAGSAILPTSTEKATAKAIQNKRSRKTNDTTVVELEPAAPVNKTTATKGKRPREVDDTAVMESEQLTRAKKAKSTVGKAKRDREGDDTAAIDQHAAPTKKKKTTPTKNTKIEAQSESQYGARRSSRSRTVTPKAKAKRTRRTKEDIMSDKAKAEEEKYNLPKKNTTQ